MIHDRCQVSFNPFNHAQLCVSGAGVFKLFRYAEGCLKQSSFAKVESIHLLSHAWIAPERVVAGTDTGRLLVFENGDLRRELLMSADRSERAADRRFPIQPSLSVSKTGFHRQVEMKRIKGSDLSQNPTGLRVASVVSFSRGFACSLGSGRICLFVKNENDSFTRSRDIWVKKNRLSLLN